MSKQIVMFSSNDSGYRISFKGTFRSEKMLNKFMDIWQYVGGFLRFNYDLLYTLDSQYPEAYPIIPTTYRGYKFVMTKLYPHLIWRKNE